ncbi:hypothetical protein CANCADRAFT_1241 [Tortispora caseinolytica NRRL Y-17796]|uniref:Mannosyl-oligosaccharide glucosidase n=1 Tax=Tortispora caseinolytica NRRL Y-17796 TaxID=767744 RepID=A0A1E4TLL1_9ASCO|nr:hypothetical protein CANCADRAFT_1241 [Tortispora caseinolytica NRRL Y-17796]
MVLIDGQQVVTAEEQRTQLNLEKPSKWKKWGPYLSERQWATVREDYSSNGDAWGAFPHSQAPSRAYRWGEDGIGGVSDDRQRLCVSFAFWNEKDPILKERLFGLTGHEGNHGEDVKELYYYLDNVPSHSYMKYLYKYPQSEYPYQQLVDAAKSRNRLQPEYELSDTGIFNNNKFFDCFIEMAKDDANAEELNFKITCTNRSAEPAPLHVLVQVYFRNTWVWDGKTPCASASKLDDHTVKLQHNDMGQYKFQVVDASIGNVTPELLFTDNETNFLKLFGQPNRTPYVKDAFHERVIHGKTEAVNPHNTGTKSAAWFKFSGDQKVPAGESAVIRCRLSNADSAATPVNAGAIDNVISSRKKEADEFYGTICRANVSPDLKNIQRQAFSGLLWGLQFYNLVYSQWINGDKSMPPPPESRKQLRNMRWKHIHMEDVLSMPDKWEYPFFAAWDLAFHCLPIAMIDPGLAKRQLLMMTREFYMHPNGQIPAYEWNFSDVNPPVHAWSALRIYEIEREVYGREDPLFLARIFQKLLMNFTWWINTKDPDGNFLYEGGFLGLDNIGLFNRSEDLPTGGVLEQADATGWMGFYCCCMLKIALILTRTRPAYQDICCKFLEHFLYIADAISFNGTDMPLWDEKDGFYYDFIVKHDIKSREPIPVRSFVGFIPLFAVGIIEKEDLERNPELAARLEWFKQNKPDLIDRNIQTLAVAGKNDRLMLSLVPKDRLIRVLKYMLDESEFLSQYGIRSLSKYHEYHPYSRVVNGEKFEVNFVPGDSDSGLFGGNSNWRGPVWLPTTYLLLESLEKFYDYYGDTLKVAFPTGSQNHIDLHGICKEVGNRLVSIFAQDSEGRRAYTGGNDLFDKNEHFRDHVLFYEYFHADNGRGIGASHQTGWTALIAKVIENK